MITHIEVKLESGHKVYVSYYSGRKTFCIFADSQYTENVNTMEMDERLFSSLADILNFSIRTGSVIEVKDDEVRIKYDPEECEIAFGDKVRIAATENDVKTLIASIDVLSAISAEIRH